MSSTSGIGPDGKVYCKHMEEAAKRKSNTSKHPNREFYCCKRPQSDASKCNFWYWADKVPRAKSDIPTSYSPATVQPHSTASRSSEEANNSMHTTATPSKRPPQKHLSPLNDSSDTPRSGGRLEDIEVGLRQREEDLSPTRDPGPSKEREFSTSLDGVHTIPQPPSPVPTEVVDSEVDTPPRKSFLGLAYSPEPAKQEGQPSSPKKRRLTPPAEGTADAVSVGGGLPLTPPQTTRRVAQSDGTESVSAIMRSGKGKEREGVLSVKTQDQDGGSWEPQEEDSLPLFTLPEDTSSISSVSPTTAENVLDYTDGVKARVKGLSEYMESFDVTQAVKLLQTIERQKVQYECRDRSQKMRIEELVAERDRLAAEVARLKEALRRAEEGSGM